MSASPSTMILLAAGLLVASACRPAAEPPGPTPAPATPPRLDGVQRPPTEGDGRPPAVVALVALESVDVGDQTFFRFDQRGRAGWAAVARRSMPPGTPVRLRVTGAERNHAVTFMKEPLPVVLFGVVLDSPAGAAAAPIHNP
ncbi:MAG: hypothetical protein HY904_09290 [Deltaproteobacteria bacterium]|nr:hypothetical protein [Deltaproteobacteria bacterium]